MKIKTAEASNKQLDWALAEAEGFKPELRHGNIFVPFINHECASHKLYSHTDPRVCMGLIEQYKPDVVYRAEQWGAEIPHNNNQFWSPCLAQAVARCVISMRLGDEFEVPDELGVQS